MKREPFLFISLMLTWILNICHVAVVAVDVFLFVISFHFCYCFAVADAFFSLSLSQLIQWLFEPKRIDIKRSNQRSPQIMVTKFISAYIVSRNSTENGCILCQWRAFEKCTLFDLMPKRPVWTGPAAWTNNTPCTYTRAIVCCSSF